jgi:hypothetical protein
MPRPRRVGEVAVRPQIADDRGFAQDTGGCNDGFAERQCVDSSLDRTYWLIVLAAYVIRGRLQVRKAQPGPDGRVMVSGELTFVRLATVLLGIPVALILLLWLLTIL